MKFHHFILAAVTMALFSPLLQGAEVLAIERLRFDPAEMHFGDTSKIQLVPSEQLGELPIPILDDSGNGFVKITMPDGSEGWINRADVKIGGGKRRAVCAKTRVYTQPEDKRSAQLRGIGRDCK